MQLLPVGCMQLGRSQKPKNGSKNLGMRQRIKRVAFQPEGAEAFTSKTNIGHPGLHDGCECGVSAAI